MLVSAKQATHNIVGFYSNYTSKCIQIDVNEFLISL